MKYKVINRFRDKHTMKIYEASSEYESKDKKRADELIKKGFLKEKKKPAKKS